MNSRVLASALACTLPLSSIHAQDEAAAQEPQVSPQEILTKAVQKMSQLNGVAFQTIESQNSVMSRNIARQVGGAMGGAPETETRGTWAHGILNARLNDDADQVVSYRGRMIAKNDDVQWKLRRNRLVSGGKLPFVLDPGRFFEALQALPKDALTIKASSQRKYKGKEVTVLSVTLQGEHAQDFALSGALPAVSSGMGGGMMVMRAMGGGGAPAALPELTVDLAFYIDPATGYVHKARSRSYQESPMGGNVQIQVRGGGGGGFGGGGLKDGDEEKMKEKDEKGQRIYKSGLPVRKLGEDLSRMDYDVVFTKHDLPVDHKLDASARKLLRIAPK